MSVSVDKYYIKRGSTAGIRMKLLQGNGQPMPVEDATQIRLQMRNMRGAGSLTMDRPATVIDAATGEVEAVPLAGEVAVAGDYLGEWRLTYAGGDIVVPNGDYIRFIILDDLAPNT